MTDDTTTKLARATGFGVSGGTSGGPLKDRFTYPPFSVWNTRDEYWIKRRRLWVRLGLQSEIGRADKLTFKFPTQFKSGEDCQKIKAQTSVFDPVVCELCLRWWCPPGGVVVDPFAGGSVRGIVAACLGLKYWGSELREEQVAANNTQRAALRDTVRDMAGAQAAPPKWVCGDSTHTLATAPDADMLFTCPPYGNLEVYSDDPADISGMGTDQFLAAYAAIIAQAAAKLRNNRFAAFVVSTYRDQRSGKDPQRLVDLPGETTRACAAAGLRYYNEIMLVNSVGTAAMRAELNFVRGARKVVNCHQSILIYVKGDERAAADHIEKLQK